MNRRGFIQISSVALLPLLLGVFPNTNPRKKYSIRVLSDRSFGHRLRGAMESEPTEFLETDIVIVGGGIAGVSAATYLKDQDFLLIEAGDSLGGTSGSDHWKDARFATGAHYELAYPKSFGKEVIELLSEMGLIAWNTFSNMYEFTDQRFVIDSKQMEQCFRDGQVISDVLDGADGAKEFEAILNEYNGQMHLPTRLISEALRELNAITFEAFLRERMKLSDSLKRRIDYQMLDDWGGRSDQVSALAGIHYYTCRPYDQKDVQLFSHPTGNKYFIEEMVGRLPSPEAILTNTLVSKVDVTEEGVMVRINQLDGAVKEIRAKNVIYAGQKHVLKYITSPELSAKSPQVDYAPWVVLNFVCKKGVTFDKWQNDIVTDKMEFLGFVNSQSQHKTSKTHDVFTAYYCFESDDRAALVAIEEHPEKVIEATIKLIEKETDTLFEESIEHVTIKLMGHAMPIPAPNYLSFKQTTEIHPNIQLAGVDTGRLPLFFEACDSGIQAAKVVLNNLHLQDDGASL